MGQHVANILVRGNFLTIKAEQYEILVLVGITCIADPEIEQAVHLVVKDYGNKISQDWDIALQSIRQLNAEDRAFDVTSFLKGLAPGT
jgi:hypothetical protein